MCNAVKMNIWKHCIKGFKQYQCGAGGKGLSPAFYVRISHFSLRDVVNGIDYNSCVPASSLNFYSCDNRSYMYWNCVTSCITWQPFGNVIPTHRLGLTDLTASLVDHFYQVLGSTESQHDADLTHSREKGHEHSWLWDRLLFLKGKHSKGTWDFLPLKWLSTLTADAQRITYYFLLLFMCIVALSTVTAKKCFNPKTIKVISVQRERLL